MSHVDWPAKASKTLCEQREPRKIGSSSSLRCSRLWLVSSTAGDAGIGRLFAEIPIEWVHETRKGRNVLFFSSSSLQFYFVQLRLTQTLELMRAALKLNCLLLRGSPFLTLA